MILLKEGKTNLQYILIVVILAAVVGGGILGYQYWLAPKEKPRMPEIKPPEVKAPEEVPPKEEVPPEEVPADEIADWKTYQNPNGGFQINYPPEMNVETRVVEGTELLPLNEVTEVISFSLPNGVRSGFQIQSAADIKDPSNNIADPKILAELFQKTPSATPIEMSEILIGGKVGYKLEFKTEPPIKAFIIYLFGKNQKSLLAITVTTTNEQQSQTVDRMLPTFTFIE